MKDTDFHGERVVHRVKGLEDAVPSVLVPAHEGRVSVPSTTEFAAIRNGARGEGRIRDLHQVVAAWQAVAQKCHLAFGEMLRLAIFRLEVERDLGEHLARVVKHGGDRSKRREGDVRREGGLPQGISAKQSSIYQQLAAIPEPVFRAYVDKTSAACMLPSSTGARRYAQVRPASGPRSASKPMSLSLPSIVEDAVGRIMAPDVVVGRSGVAAKRVIPANRNALDHLSGDVFVAECVDPTQWLPALLRLRSRAKIQRAVIVLPAAVWENWFRVLGEEPWSCCFLFDVRDVRGVGCVVAHIGARDSSFRVAFAEVGTLF